MSKFKPFVVEKPRHRPQRFAQRLKEELSSMIPRDLKDPVFDKVPLVTITHVEVTPDLKYSDIGFSLMGQNEHSKAIEQALAANARDLRRELMHRLGTKVTPHLRFKFDDRFEIESHISELLRKVQN